ncbi:GNAT family N-acetyltransferase [Paenibacillus tengchongensis]|uniref:GNAT family N-acetyltransferase n=1 Tax=Paenibacillus tengchongensis TaxID=2608684 RepID=UPI001FEBEB88|nr:GNAT family N-acetyltransferase [Paenibacillus tengchongensis]
MWERVMQTYRVEEISTEAVELAAPLFDAYRRYYQQEADLQGAERFLRQRLEAEESVLFAAVTGEGPDKRAVGLAHLYPSFSSVTLQKLWILNDLFVAAELRGQGIGSLLLRRVEEFARETGSKGLTLTTMTDNHSAQRLYEAHGYIRDEEFWTYNRFY